jgi:pyruvate formate-lyase activating enzyme-like uncharacterized protein
MCYDTVSYHPGEILMKLEVDEGTLASIHNPVLRNYAEQYIRIEREFLDQIRNNGIEIASAENDKKPLEVRLLELKRKGATLRNNSKSVFVNRISPACQACQTSIGSATLFISLKCHRNCFYCFNPNQENYAYYRDHTRDTVAELEALRKHGKIKHLALTGGEPLLHKNEAVRFFQAAQQISPKIYTRLYTSGDFLDQQTLERLKDASLDEVRFSIRLHDLEKGQRHTYDQIALSRVYIPNVMVEMPVLPNTLEQMKEVMGKLEKLGIFGINLLEFCFPFHNAEEYTQRGYRIKARPYRVLYNYWYAGGLPVAGSEEECLDLIEYALDEKINLGVHYCSLENKHTGQIYQQNSIRPLPKTMYFSPGDYFLKSAKVFGNEINQVRRFFQKTGNKNYVINEKYNYLEFHVRQIKSLQKMDIEVGLSTNVIENRDGERFIRELKLDITTAKDFILSEDL